jgi:glutathione S-transferase
MPVDRNSTIEITAFNWVPKFAQGLVRDLRVRWALEELGLSYRVRLLDATATRPADYFCEQPFGQVPIFTDGDIRMFETGAILLHLGERGEALMPRDAVGRARTMCWLIAALNSIEPLLMEFANVNIFAKNEEWARLRRPSLMRAIDERLGRLADALGEKKYLEDRFTVADLLMTTVLRNLRDTDLVERHDNLAAYKARCEARPAFRRALEAQLANFEDREAA